MLLSVALLGACSDDKKEKAVGDVQVEEDDGIRFRPIIDVQIGDWGFVGQYDKHCWEEGETKECSLTPSLPKEFFEHERPFKIEPGGDIHFRFDIPLDDWDFPEPEVYEAFIQEGDQMKQLDVNDEVVKAPLEAGRYYMSVKGIWNGEGDVKGEAIYMFYILVQEE